MIRLFVALNIPEEIKQKIIEIRNSIVNDHYNYKWEPLNKYHLTLKFIGDVEDHLVDEISGSLNFINNYNAFNCKLTRFGFFYKRNLAKILWLGLETDDRINNLVDELNKELEKFGIPVEKRKFKAHLTLMRIKKKVNNDFINKFKDYNIDEIKFIADEISLIKSELLSKGSKYTEIKKFKLK